MGNFEKLVVLAVLFLSAIVLAVSLNEDANEVEAGDPITAALERVDEEQPAPSADSPRAEGLRLAEAGPSEPPVAPPTTKKPNWLLNSETSPAASEEAPPTPERELRQAGRPRILTATGLEPSASPDTMLYTVSAGDTWNGLAMRFYGDGRYTQNLRRANDDPSQLRIGDAILVPVYDDLKEAGRAPFGPGDTVPAVDPGAPGEPTVVTPTAVPTIGEIYVVKSGDSLSKIAQLAYRDGSKWRPIFDANRDQMRTPDWLQVGMKLVIPDPDKAVTTQPVDPNKPRVR